MRHVIKGFLLLFLVLLSSGWWIYSKYVIHIFKEDRCGEWKVFEDCLRAKVKTISSDIKENEIYVVDIRDLPISTRKKRNVDIFQICDDDDDQPNVKKQREKTKGMKIEEVERIDIKIDEIETYPRGISHIPASERIENEKEVRQQYENGDKYLKNLKEILQGNEVSRDVKFEDDFLRAYITSNDYKIDEAFSKIQNLLGLRIDHNYFFQNISFDFTQYPEYRFITILPHKRKDGSVTVLLELAKWDPDKVPLEHLKQIMFIVYMQAIRNPVSQENGINMINDFANIGFRYIKVFSPQNLYLLHHMTFETIPAKYVGFHIVNANAVGRILVSLMRQFIPEHIVKITHTHSSVKELLDFFPPSMLPVQLGGTLTDYYAADWIRKANQQHGNYPVGGQKNIINKEFINI